MYSLFIHDTSVCSLLPPGIYCQDTLQAFIKTMETMKSFDHDNMVRLLASTTAALAACHMTNMWF